MLVKYWGYYDDQGRHAVFIEVTVKLGYEPT